MTKTSLNLKSVISSHKIIGCKIDKLKTLLGYCQPQAWHKLQISMASISTSTLQRLGGEAYGVAGEIFLPPKLRVISMF